MYLVKCSNFSLKSETRDECRSYCPANRARLGSAELSPMGCYQPSPQVEPSQAPCLLTAHSPRRLGSLFWSRRIGRITATTASTSSLFPSSHFVSTKTRPHTRSPFALFRCRGGILGLRIYNTHRKPSESSVQTKRALGFDDGAGTWAIHGTYDQKAPLTWHLAHEHPLRSLRLSRSNLSPRSDRCRRAGIS